MKNSKAVLTALLLLGITIFSVFKYILTVREKNDLVVAIEKIKVEAVALENEKERLLKSLEEGKALQQSLTQENVSFQEKLIVTEAKLSGIEEELIQAQKELADSTFQAFLIKEESIALQKERADLRLQIIKLTRENEDFTTHFNSVAELKKAIQELKLKMRQVKREIKKKAVLISDSEGNKGFVVRDGKSTQPAQVKIEVKPAS
jgi:chromosome segregation ATPase